MPSFILSGPSSIFPGLRQILTKPRPITIFLVHGLTASGAVIAFMALDTAYRGQWEITFLWLGLALIIDGIDGPIARRLKIDPDGRFSGGRIDLVVDYLNYVFIPAVVLAKSGIVPGVQGLILAGLILLSSLYHFSDTRSKAEDNSFIGFPAIWNVVIFFMFVFQPSSLLATIIILIFAILTFVPLHWSHPVRNVRQRLLTIFVITIAAGASIWIVFNGFHAEAAIARIILAIAAFYGLALVVINRLRQSHCDIIDRHL